MKIVFKWIGGATFILSIDDLNIAVDPVLCDKGTVQDFFWFKSERIEKAIGDRSIDLMIPNMGAAKEGSWIMTLTLNSKMLKRLIDELNPKTVIPVHYGTFKHYIEPVDTIKSLNDSSFIFVKPGQKTNIS